MGDFCIALCGSNGCIFVVNKHLKIEEDTDEFGEDELLLEVIKSDLKTHEELRKCEVKSPSEDSQTLVIAYGNFEERKSIFGAIKDERRSYLLSFYKSIPLNMLSNRMADFMRKMSSSCLEIILASWTDKHECELYTANSKGESFKCFGCVVGYQKEFIKEALQRLDFKALNVRQLLTDVVKIAVNFCDEDDDLQLSWICDETNGQHQKCDKRLVDGVMRSIRN